MGGGVFFFFSKKGLCSKGPFGDVFSKLFFGFIGFWYFFIGFYSCFLFLMLQGFYKVIYIYLCFYSVFAGFSYRGL